MQTIDLSTVNWKDLIDYNETTGEARWLKRVSPSAGLGDIIGSKTANGYIKFLYKRKTYLLHRVLFFMATGIQPQEVDHINHNKTDNRISNLRDCSRRQNEYNKKVSPLSATGVKGVSINENGTYRARARVDGKRVNVGTFKTLKEAEKAVINFRLEYQKEYSYEQSI